jgi:hypothetical protein
MMRSVFSLQAACEPSDLDFLRGGRARREVPPTDVAKGTEARDESKRLDEKGLIFFFARRWFDWAAAAGCRALGGSALRSP